MADETKKKLSNLPRAVELDEGALFLVSSPDSSTETGYSSMTATPGAIAERLLGNTRYETELETEAKTIFEAINEAAQTGGGGGGDVTKAYVDEQNALQDAETDKIKADLTELNNKMPYLISEKDGKNIYDPSLVIEGKQLYSNGSLGNNASYNFTGYIDISGCTSGSIAVMASMAVYNASTQSAFYDENKNPVTTRNQVGTVYERVPFTCEIPTNAKYFGIAYLKEHFSDISWIMVQDGTEFTGYEPYGFKEVVVLPSDEVVDARGSYTSLKDRIDSLPQGDSSMTLVYWGDSLTEGNQAGDDGSRPNSMRTLLPNWEIFNFGRGGDKSNSIACRQGGMNIVVKPNQTIPSSGSVILDIEDNYGNDVGVRIYNVNGENNKSLNPCYINGVKGTLVRVDSSYELNKALFTRETSGDAVVINRPTTVISNGANEYKGHPCIILAGQNEGFDTNNPSELLNQIKSMVKWANTDKYLVIGLCHTRSYAWQGACNELLKNEFGRKFIDVEKYMKTPIYNGDNIVSSYALADEGITPTSEDLTKIADNLYPTSIMYDGIHFNKFGYDCIAKLEYQRGKELGYWS